MKSGISRTASWTCFCRAIAYSEKNQYFKGSDYISYKLVPFLPKVLFIKCRFLQKIFFKYLSPRGIYQYVFARTKVIDEYFESVLKKGFKQIVIFGAGFDSRAVRFNDMNRNTMIFELDSPLTQKAKINIFKKKKIDIPEKVIFIPIDFNKQKLAEVLFCNKYKKDVKTLFVLEGVTMYLDESAVIRTLDFIAGHSKSRSLLLFDYIYKSVLRKENKYYGEKDVYRRVAAEDEAWTFGIEEGWIKKILDRLGFVLKKHYDSNALTERYLKTPDGVLYGKINETHAIAVAEVK